ncbi:MAG: DUF4391 domain-containing protein [candidate division Zixibacteria bacterium]|nr:DUF4391 domain-containing protein [candidate division Zixibacteria bacterium]
MSFAPVITALNIPAGALVDQRVPKKLLVEQGAPTAADKRQIQDGVEEITWVAALKPTNIGVPAFRDAVREYLEIAVLTVALRPVARSPRLIELIHRAIPYPLVLVAEHRNAVSLSLAHKRWSQGEAEKVVIEEVRQVPLNTHAPTTVEASFLARLAVSQLPARDLFALYDGLLQRLAALEAARIAGTFTPPESSERASTVRDGLDLHARLQRDIATLRATAAKEKQINRRVKLNMEIKRLEAELAETQRIL